MEALRGEGFGVLTAIDGQATLRQKLNADFRRYVILAACNPPLAHRALSANLDVGLLLPGNVTVYENGDASVVTAADPVVMRGSCRMMRRCARWPRRPETGSGRRLKA